MLRRVNYPLLAFLNYFPHPVLLEQGRYKDAINNVKDAKKMMQEINKEIKMIDMAHKRSQTVFHVIRIGSTHLSPPSTVAAATQYFTQGEVWSVFAATEVIALSFLTKMYTEDQLSESFIGFKFKKHTFPFLLWQHEKRKRGNL